MRKIIALPVSALMTAAFFAAVSAPASAKPICTPSTVAEADALRMAAACKSKVEIQGLRTEKEKFFANPDGSQSFEISAVPARIRKDGVLQDIDTTLKQGKDGRWAPKAAVEASFSDGGDGPFVVSDVDGNRFELSWPTTLAKPQADGATLTYPGVLPDVDLAVTVTRAGYTYALVVKTAAAAANPALAKISYRVSGDLEARNGADGSIQLVDKKGQVTSVGSHASSMWDSAVNPALGGEVLPGVSVDASKIAASTAAEPGPAARVRGIQARAEGSNLVVIPDADLLKNGTLPLFIDPPLDRYRTGWAYAHSNNGNWTPGEHARVGRNPDDGLKFRSFFEFSMSGIQGVQITDAHVHINLDHAAACAGNTAYLYRASGIGGAVGTRVDWSHGIAGPLSSAWGQSNEAGGCGVDQGDDPLVFGGTNFKNDVQYGSDQGWGTYTIGLCMCSDTSGTNESGTYQWMKFHHGYTAGTPIPVLAGTYNRPPGTPANLTTSTVACGGTIGTTSPVLSAQFVDPDGSDTLSSTFYWKELPSGSTTTVAGPSKPANNYGTVTLSLGAAAEGKTYSWQVKTSDGISATQPYSPWCNFTVNASPPPLPGVSSSAYPADGVSHGSPGLPGVFTFTNGGGTAGQDVISYTYGWTDPPTTTVTVSAGASANVTLSPPNHGYNMLHVFSKDPAGTPGPTKHYQFLTNTPAAPLAHWPLDDIGGHGLNNQISSSNFVPDAVNNDVTWTPDVRYVGSNAASFNAVTETPTDLKGVLQAAGAGLDTSGSFSASVWVRLNPVPSCTNMIALSVDSVVHNGFSIGYNCWGNNWRFAIPEKDVHSAVSAYATSTSVPVSGRWTNLTVVWDEPASKMRLFVDGVLEADVTPDAAWLANRGTGWAATGPVIAGRGMWNYFKESEWRGEIADIRLWNRAVSIEDLTGTNADAVAGTQAVPGILQPVQVGNWNFNDYDSLDGSYWARHASLYSGTNFADPGHDGNTGLLLDGTAGGAAASPQVLRCDQSFTISAWVKVNATNTDQTVVMQGGWPWWSTTLNLSGTTGKWGFGVSNDLGGGNYGWAWAESNVPATAGVWTHLTGVFNRATGQTRLYVNGVEQTSKGTGGVGWNGVSSLHIGSTWGNAIQLNGQIDQVKAYAGAMNNREVANLYAETS